MNKEDRILKVAGYIRVSTDSQAREGESLQIQEQEIAKYASAYGYHLVEIFRDEGISGGSKDRLGLTKLRQAAKAQKFSKVIFTKLSRFGRNVSDLLELFREFEEGYKVGLVCIKENFDTSTSSGRLLRTVLAAIAEFERDTIRTQMKEGKFSKLKKKETFLGRVPYGYSFNKEKKVIEAVEEEKAAYEEIVDMFLNQNLSMNDIAATLNREGRKSPKGQRWTTITLSYILKNPAYKGESIVNLYEYEMAGKNSRRKYEVDKTGKRTPIMKSENEWVKFPFPQFVDEHRWNQIQNKIGFNTIKPKNEKYPHLFLAGGLIKCGICGSKVSIRNGVPRKDGVAPHYYACHWAIASQKGCELHGKTKCPLPSVKMEDVDDHLWMRIVNLLTYPEKNLKEFLSTSNSTEGELLKKQERIRVALKENEKKISNLRYAISLSRDRDAIRTLAEEIELLSKEKRDLSDEEHSVKAELDLIRENEEVLASVEFSKYRDELKKCLYTLPGVEKKHIIRVLVSPESGGQITLRPMTEGDKALDDRIFFDKKVKATTVVEGHAVVDFEFQVAGERIVGALTYLKNKGFLSDKVTYKRVRRYCRI